MGNRTVEIVRLVVEPHPVAGVLDMARIGQSVVVMPKGSFHSGDLAAFIPENARVPSAVLAWLGLTAMLAGSGSTRVKAIRLGGVLSQGLLYPVSALHGSSYDGVLLIPSMGRAPVGQPGPPLNAGDGRTGVPLPVKLGQDVQGVLGITFDGRSDDAE